MDLFYCISDHKNFIPKYLDIYHETPGSYFSADGAKTTRQNNKGYVCMYEFPVLRVL